MRCGGLHIRFRGGHLTLRTAAVLILSAFAAFAQAGGAISGKVVDDSGTGLADLKVVAANQASGAEKEVRSGPGGEYSLEVEPGVYTVRVEKSGMGRFGVREVRVAAGDKPVVTLELSARTDNRNFRYMFYGFLAAWLILVIYVISLVARERGLRKQIDDLKRMVESERR